MSQVVIELLRSAPYLKDAKVVMGADMDDLNPDTRQLRTEPFVGKSTGTSLICIQHYKSNGGYVWDKTYVPETEMKGLIRDCAITHPITKKVIEYDDINFFDEDDPFFCNTNMTLTLKKGSIVIDDSLARNKVMCAFFMADEERFLRVHGDEEPSFSTQVYSIGLVENMEKVRDVATADIRKASAKLDDMVREQLKVLAKIWEINVTDNTSDETIKNRLFEIISRSPSGPKTRAAFFNKFAGFSRDTMLKYDLFMDGRRERIISQNDDDMFVFNGTILGRDMDDSVTFLSQSMNREILKTLKEGVQFRKNRYKDELNVYDEHIAKKPGKPGGKIVTTPPVDPEGDNDLEKDGSTEPPDTQ